MDDKSMIERLQREGVKWGVVSLRCFLAALITWLGFLFFATFSTDGWYLTSGWWLRSLRVVTYGSAIAVALMAPFSWMPLVGCGWRAVVAGMILIPFTSVFSAEVFGRAQELALLHRYGEKPSHTVHVERWWPFTHHAIAGGPKYGWSGWD